VPRVSERTVTFWREPFASGAGRPATAVAAFQFASVIVEVETRMSYSVAVPMLPSSPGAVHVRLTLSAPAPCP
jgi:hypothetical protein